MKRGGGWVGFMGFILVLYELILFENFSSHSQFVRLQELGNEFMDLKTRGNLRDHLAEGP